MKQVIKICFVLSLLYAALFSLPATSSSAPTLQYSWDMDVNPGWSAEGLWGWGQPTGGGGEYGFPDPTSGYTGSNVYGYNLLGDYQLNLRETHLTSTAIDCTGLSQVTLKFRRWLGVEEWFPDDLEYDHAYISVSNDGSTWTMVWENPETEIAENSWSLQELNISSVADNQPTVYLRWTMGTTDDSWQYCGWNIDDVEIWAVSAPAATTDSATFVSSSSTTLNGTVNPNDALTTVVFEYGLSTSYGSTATAVQSPLTGTTSQAVSAGITGLTQGTTYHYRVVATNSAGTGSGSDRTFTTSESCPACSGSRVVLENVTFPPGEECYCIASISITAGTGVTVKSGATVTFLAPTVNLLSGFHAEDGAVVRIRQQPVATTGSATSISSYSATLNGTVNPNGASTTVVFEYGLSTSYGSTATAAQSPLTGTTSQAVSAGITGLTPGTTYHYRVVAMNGVATGSGSDRTFTTVKSCSECSGSRVVLENVTFPSGEECECIASISITAGTGVTVENGAIITFQAPTIKLKSGFHTENGAVVKIRQQ